MGAAAGAITGGITAARIDLGFSQQTIEELQHSLRPGGSAILALVERDWAERVIGEISVRRGRIIRQMLRGETIRRIRKERNKD